MHKKCVGFFTFLHLCSVVFSAGIPCTADLPASDVFTFEPPTNTEIEVGSDLDIVISCNGSPIDSVGLEAGGSFEGRPLSPQTLSCTKENQGEDLTLSVDIDEWYCFGEYCFWLLW